MNQLALWELIWDNNLTEIERRLRGGEDPNARDEGGATPLMIAATESNLEAARLLLRYGALVNPPTKRPLWTALHGAAQSGSIDMIRLLLEHGAELNAVDEHGNTPLSKAITLSGYKPEVARFLLKAGADPDIKNNYGISPRDIGASLAAASPLHSMLVDWPKKC